MFTNENQPNQEYLDEVNEVLAVVFTKAKESKWRDDFYWTTKKNTQEQKDN